MNELFHYYAVQFLCLRSGFSSQDAWLIAYSNQLVDRAIVPITVIMDGGKEFVIHPTHHFGFWDWKQEHEVWKPFHFFPSADNSQSLRIDGRKNPAIVHPDSDPVKELLIDALKTRNLYRIGIALHSYADSWAHQNFVGQDSSLNKMEPLSPMPPAGHAHVAAVPDIWSMEWLDNRLLPEYQICNNHERFMHAAEKTYKYLATFNGRPFIDWPLIRGELEATVLDNRPEEESDYPRKNQAMSDSELEIEFRLKLETDALDTSAWFKEAGIRSDGILRNTHTSRVVFAKHEIRRLLKLQRLPPSRAGTDFTRSHIYQWSLASREHRKAAEGILKQL